MKKFISIIVAVIMIASLIPAVVNAEADDDEYVRSGDNGNVIVPYTTGEGITIDGTLAQGEWSETNKLALEGKKTMKTWGIGTFEGTIDFYYSWGDAGLYMAAVVYDDLIGDGASDGATLSTRFQIALNPAGIICEDYAGLFFSITPVADSNDVLLMRHNWETQADGGYFVEEDEGFSGKYTFIQDGENIIGWNMECVIPWAMIASEDRYADLDETDEIYLTNFNPKDENRARAFCTATIAYVQHFAPDAASIKSTARTCTDGDPTIWTVDSYDIILLFALPGETDRSTDTEYFTPTAVTTEEVTTEEVTTEEVTTEEVTTEEATKEVTTEATTTEEVTDAETTAAPTTDKPAETTPGGGLSTGAIIGIIIAAVVVVAAVIIAIVLGKKKKA